MIKVTIKYTLKIKRDIIKTFLIRNLFSFFKTTEVSKYLQSKEAIAIV